jgi:hypothetical protein
MWRLRADAQIQIWLRTVWALDASGQVAKTLLANLGISPPTPRTRNRMCEEGSATGFRCRQLNTFHLICGEKEATIEHFGRIMASDRPSGRLLQIETPPGRFRCYNKRAATLGPVGLLALTKAGPPSIFGRFGNSSRFCYGFAFARIASPYPQFAPVVIPVTIALYPRMDR